jgi:hypothetical protein
MDYRVHEGVLWVNVVRRSEGAIASNEEFKWKLWASVVNPLELKVKEVNVRMSVVICKAELEHEEICWSECIYDFLVNIELEIEHSSLLSSIKKDVLHWGVEDLKDFQSVVLKLSFLPIGLWFQSLLEHFNVEDLMNSFWESFWKFESMIWSIVTREIKSSYMIRQIICLKPLRIESSDESLLIVFLMSREQESFQAVVLCLLSFRELEEEDRDSSNEYQGE